MNATHTPRTAVKAGVSGAAAIARRAQKTLIGLALALGAILLALSATVAHAAPGDVQDGPNPPNMPPGQTTMAPPPGLHASENPVFFGPFETTRYITLTATPYNETVRGVWLEDGVPHCGCPIIVAGTPVDLPAEIHYGKTYTAFLETMPENGPPTKGPVLTITTKRPQIATFIPQPPDISTKFIPNRPAPN
jgi:hypothetical protein